VRDTKRSEACLVFSNDVTVTELWWFTMADPDLMPLRYVIIVDIGSRFCCGLNAAKAIIDGKDIGS